MARNPASPKVPRRKVLHWLAAAPAAAAVGGSTLAQEIEEFGQLEEFAGSKDREEAKAGKGVSADARCIADAQEDLSRKERRALLEKMKGLEGALKTLREFEVADRVEPAMLFRPLRPAGRGGR